MFSIVIPTLNNLSYLKKCIESIHKNSEFDHEIIIHSNIGNDGTLEYLNQNNIKYTYTSYNSGICEGVNTAAKMSSKKYILYAHDDFYFCPGWDTCLFNEVKKIGHNKFYLSGTMIEKNGKVNLDCGENLKSFNEQKLLSTFDNLKAYDFQGSTWAPHLIHADIWRLVGGFSEEFYPGTGSDPDLNMKLWNNGVRIFKGMKDCKVYHFGSIVTRKNINKSIKTESGSKGAKIFLLKWGLSIKFFKKHFLLSDTIYKGPLNNPKKNLLYLFDYYKCRLSYYYLMMLRFFN